MVHNQGWGGVHHLKLETRDYRNDVTTWAQERFIKPLSVNTLPFAQQPNFFGISVAHNDRKSPFLQIFTVAVISPSRMQALIIFKVIRGLPRGYLFILISCEM